jgi:hypothetical protein
MKLRREAGLLTLLLFFLGQNYPQIADSIHRQFPGIILRQQHYLYKGGTEKSIVLFEEKISLKLSTS